MDDPVVHHGDDRPRTVAGVTASESAWRTKDAGPQGRLRPRVVLAVLAALVLVVAYPGMRTGVLTMGLLAELVELDPRLLSAVTQAPRRTSLTYGAEAPDRMDVYVPADAIGDRSKAAVVPSLGVHPPPLDHPDVVRIASGIARLGVVVAVPDSTALRQTRVTPDEPRRLAEAVLEVAAMPEVDPERVGLAGFSAGAGLALVASADPRVAHRLAFVSAFGAYADAEVLMVDVATRTMERAGTIRPWAAEPGIRRDVALLAVDALLPSSDRDRLAALLEPVVASGDPPSGSDGSALDTLSDPDARAVYRLLTSAEREAAWAAIGDASDRLRLGLSSISPLRVAAGIRAPVFLMHGENDVAIPVSHADLIAAALPGGVLRRLTIFDLFQHGQPGQGGVRPEELPDLLELYGHLRDLVAIGTE